MKKKILLFIAIFSIGIIVTYPAFAPSHALDSYCTIHNGYIDTASIFLQNGRIFSALLMYFYNLVSLPVDSMNFVTLFFFNLFLALAITKLFWIFSDKKENKIVQGIILICTFMLFYGPLITEVLFLSEAMILALGILFVVLAAEKLALGGIKNNIISLIFMLLGVTCYQGIACYFFIILILILMSKGIKNKEDLINLLKKVGIGIILYIIAFFTSLCLVNFGTWLVGTKNSKYAGFDIINNMLYVFTELFPNSLKTLFGFVNVKYYYFVVFIIIGIIIYNFVMSDKKGIKVILFLGVLLSTLLLPFIPNFVMSSDGNYTAARMALPLGILPSVLILYFMFNYKINIKFNYIMLGVILVFMVLSFYSIHQNTMISFRRYKEDVKYINSVVQEINSYENDTDNKVKKIYYASDTSVNYYYSFGNANGANIRLLAVDWALDCAFPVYTYDKYEFKKMSDEDYEKYFKDKNYDEFDEEQFVFEDDTLYLLIY